MVLINTKLGFGGFDRNWTGEGLENLNCSQTVVKMIVGYHWLLPITREINWQEDANGSYFKVHKSIC